MNEMAVRYIGRESGFINHKDPKTFSGQKQRGGSPSAPGSYNDCVKHALSGPNPSFREAQRYPSGL
jgi:hypothetical protein